VYAVWGDAYVALFKELALPTIVAQVDGLADGDKSRYSCKIYTTARDAENIRGSAAYAALAGAIHVEFLLIDDLAVSDRYGVEKKYGMMAECHRRAIGAALRDEAVIVFILPDTLWSAGFLPKLQRHVDAGIKVVLLPGLRVVKEAVAPLVAERFRSSDGTRLSIPARELVAIGMAHLHVFTERMIVNSGSFDDLWPSNVYWRVEGEGLLARCFHLHPLLVDPAGLKDLPSSTLDSDLICRLPLSAEDFHLVADSDEMTHYDLCTEAMKPTREPSGFSAFRIAAWAANNTNADHRRYFNEKFFLHSTERSPRWDAVERESDSAVRAISLLLLIRPLLFDVRAYLSRIEPLRRAYLAVKTRIS
jgi:hypothetical protein